MLVEVGIAYKHHQQHQAECIGHCFILPCKLKLGENLNLPY